MAANTLPYHLRQNKAIERQIFLDLLTRISVFAPLSTYQYIGMGGPFLEDFKAIHSLFGITEMISFDMEPLTIKRQNINKPVPFIECKLADSSEFVASFEKTEKNSIFWFDYTNPNKIKEQLDDFRSAIGLLQEGDVLKITLNLEIDSLCSEEKLRNEEMKLKTNEQIKNIGKRLWELRGNTLDDEQIRELQQELGNIQKGSFGRPNREKLQERRLYELKQKVGDYAESIEVNEMTSDAYPGVIMKILRKVVEQSLAGELKDFIFYPLCALAYADTQKMFTFTGILLNRENQATFEEKTQIQSWGFSSHDWTSIHKIETPFLSMHEKLCIDKTLLKEKEWAKDFNFYADIFDPKSFEKSKQLLTNYIKFYRYYPNFSKILV